MSSITCSSCGQRYESIHIDVLGHNEDTWFLQIRCSSCSTESLVAAIIKQEQVKNSIGSSDAEPEKSDSSVPVDADDVLDMHDFLSDFDGDFSRVCGHE
ncbi:MAG: hypothetical protein Q7R57_09135 [Dehalococcoidales bacterium]|nr:hypothetical protein [Dehalococcoidales bacterium]